MPGGAGAFTPATPVQIRLGTPNAIKGLAKRAAPFFVLGVTSDCHGAFVLLHGLTEAHELFVIRK
jgi:hypothetical protein